MHRFVKPQLMLRDAKHPLLPTAGQLCLHHKREYYRNSLITALMTTYYSMTTHYITFLIREITPTNSLVFRISTLEHIINKECACLQCYIYVCQIAIFGKCVMFIMVDIYFCNVVCCVCNIFKCSELLYVYKLHVCL